MRCQQSLQRKVIAGVDSQSIAKHVQSIFERTTCHQDLAGFREICSAFLPETEVEVTIRHLRANLGVLRIEISNFTKDVKCALRRTGAIMSFNDRKIVRASFDDQILTG